MKITLLFLLFLFSALANAQQNLTGTWEGYYSGSTNAIGSINIKIETSDCFVELSDIKSVTIFPFPCDSLRIEQGVFIFSTRQTFTEGKDWVETRYQLAMMPHITGSKVPRSIIGTWLQGMVKKDQLGFVALNSGTFKAKERLAD